MRYLGATSGAKTSVLCHYFWGQLESFFTVALIKQVACIGNRNEYGGYILGPKLLLAMGCVKLSETFCVHLPSVGEQTAN